jgi:protein involved in temperature-dependent protein secretion
MTAQSLFQAGRLDDAIGALSAELRSNPTDTQRRTFMNKEVEENPKINE